MELKWNLTSTNMRMMQITPRKPSTETLVSKSMNPNRGTRAGTLELHGLRLQYYFDTYHRIGLTILLDTATHILHWHGVHTNYNSASWLMSPFREFQFPEASCQCAVKCYQRNIMCYDYEASQIPLLMIQPQPTHLTQKCFSYNHGPIHSTLKNHLLSSMVQTHK